MKIKNLVWFTLLLSSTSSWSFTCYMTMVKDNCWKDYNVMVDVNNSRTGDKMLTITVPKGDLWNRQMFDCDAGLKLMYIARFSPVFWEKDVGKTYPALNFWSLPNEIHPGDSAWNISVCYPKDFALVPMPPQATGNCKCDFASIPIIPPKKLP